MILTRCVIVLFTTIALQLVGRWAVPLLSIRGGLHDQLDINNDSNNSQRLTYPSSSLDDSDRHHQDHPNDHWSLRSSHALRRQLAEHHNYTDPIILNNTDTDHFMVSIVYFAYINTKRENWLKLILSQVC
jgi:hypothetical protein